MFIIYFICFRLSHPRKKQIIHLLADPIQIIECESKQDQNFQNFEFHSLNLFYCETQGSIITISRCIFHNIKLYYTKSGIRRDYSFLTRFKLSTIDINNCDFNNVTYMERLISCEDPLSDAYLDESLSFHSNTITNCYDIEEGRQSLTLFSEFKKNDIINNSILYENAEHNTRTFQFRDHNGCTIIGNKIINSFYDEGSAIYFLQDGISPNQLILSDCVFTNCKGKSGSTLVINSINNEITLSNITFENCKNEYPDLLQNGYYIYLNFNCSDAKANIINCTFSYLENNFINGGGIGLKINSSDKCTILFENSTFEHLIHANSIGGGAIQISKMFYDLIMKWCSFSNITSDGNGGAIYFVSENSSITIFGCQFENVFSENGHAIFINLNRYLYANIEHCCFYDCCPKNKQNTFLIMLDSYDFNFTYNEIIFSDHEQCCRIIYSSLIDYHVYDSNVFKFIKYSEQYKYPIINEMSDNDTNSIIIQNNIFDSIDSSFQGRCICVNILNPLSLKLANNSFINCPSGGIYLFLVFQNEISDFDIDSFRFINNEISIDLMTEYESCPQVMIQNKVVSNVGSILNLNFINCHFENNSSPANGGAIQYGKNSQTVNTKVFFNNCKFIANNASNKGGAITIQTYLGCIIEDCYFSKNRSLKEGSSIYVENECTDCTLPEFKINSCVFSENEINNQNSIITADKALNVSIIITNINFTNSNTKNFIISLPTYVQSTHIENCSIEFDSSGHENCGGISINSKGKIDIKNVLFKNITTKSALMIESKEISEQINIINSTFDSCSGTNLCSGFDFICFGIDLTTSFFTFENNTIINIAETRSYIGIINCNNKSGLKFVNNNFINNSCSSLYGGGSGLYLIYIKKLELFNCTFSGNKAIQNPEYTRPIESPIYYCNGDGGGIQLGFICSSSEYDVIFDGCVFENNQAQRHGGAIALQTQATVQIINCKFTNNQANFNFALSSSSLLLFENYFNLKSNGKGGAIYINPAYEIGSSCLPKGKFMTNVKIENSNFQSNYASDGHAIYIEGDETNTSFEFQKNTFIDNFNQSKIGFNGAVISSEIHFNPESILNENSFENNKSDIIVRSFHFVNHYGIWDTYLFTFSKIFTDSKYFTKSSKFTESLKFSRSQHFTASHLFTFSDELTESHLFTLSNAFTLSHAFTFSDELTKSHLFTLSNAFTSSNDFHNNEKFTPSHAFTSSDGFTSSHLFTFSDELTESHLFTLSNKFTLSCAFTFSDELTECHLFTLSNEFTASYDFHNNEKFTSSHAFTSSEKFTPSYTFTSSDGFTSSHSFTLTGSALTNSNQNSITFSLSLSISFIKMRTVTYSMSMSASYSFIISYDQNIGTYIFYQSYGNYYYNFPYIIYYLSQTYIITNIELEVVHRKTITREQLIGLVCGSATVIFLIAYIVITIMRKKIYKKIIINDLNHLNEEEEESSEPIIYKNKDEYLQKTRIAKEECQIDIDDDSDESDLSFFL